MSKKFDKSTLLSGACMLLAGLGFLANMAKDKADEDAEREEMKQAVKDEVQAQLSCRTE